MRRKRRRKRLRYGRVFLCLAIIAGLIALGVYAFFGQTPKPKPADPEIAVSDKTTEIMVMGVDPRENDTGRSDTLLIVTMNEEERKASVLSIPRDTRVEMGEGTYEKINHAYAYGGHEYTQAIVEKLLMTKLDGYILIDIRAFERIIDAVGGVDLEVEKRMYYEDPWDDNGGLVIDLYPGEQHLDGKHAMEYVRFRDEEGDVGRIARQQKFMHALIDRLTSAEVLPQLPNIVRELSSVIETDLDIGDILRMVSMLPEVKAHGVSAAMLPGMPGWWQETSYWLPAIEEARALFASQMGIEFTPVMAEHAKKEDAFYREHLPAGLTEVDGTMVMASAAGDGGTLPAGARRLGGKKVPAPEEISVRVLNESGITGAAAEAAEDLKKRGFAIDHVGNGETTSRATTTILVPKGTESLFDGLPFPCELSVGEDAWATLTIGKDYRHE